MDYQFYCDQNQTVVVECSTEHEAVAHWMNTELGQSLSAIESTINVLEQNRTSLQETRLIGAEYTMTLQQGDVCIQANHCWQDEREDHTSTLADDLAFYHAESIAYCGVDDLLELLAQYRTFLTSN
ncbi:YacL family protein [Spirabiliibacterium falconis]|uniref:UPF0231 family protein n=1 Tax=Spirabiliibacterium falconis TaxID=572023 RepID=UPI001AADA15F|nr:YacL family protein [Spirabiliibacterium falconis]MBE2894094.1 YacL family protein [Spirabiliibacterium falconis]